MCLISTTKSIDYSISKEKLILNYLKGKLSNQVRDKCCFAESLHVKNSHLKYILKPFKGFMKPNGILKLEEPIIDYQDA